MRSWRFYGADPTGPVSFTPSETGAQRAAFDAFRAMAGYVAAGLLGLGYGCFLSVDQALATQVLPDAHTRVVMYVGQSLINEGNERED